MKASNLENENSKPTCPSCLQTQCSFIGLIPSVNCFTGNLLKSPLDGGGLYKCDKCFLMFRYPTLSKEKMDALYSQNNISVWENEAKDRSDWQIAKRWIENLLPEGSVLDVGCFDGRLLGTLSPNLAKYGIEMSADAAKQAEKIGVEIIGDDFSSLHNHVQKFDIVVTIDVVEHVKDPYGFLELISESVKPGGWLIISTGNFDSLAWRLAGSRYWYCSLAEHISFISPKWCSLAAKKMNLEIIQTNYFCHSSLNNWTRIIALIKVIYHRIRNNDGQIYGPAKDHFIVLLRKSNNTN